MIYAFIEDRCSDLPTAFVCRFMKVSTSGFYEWRHHRSHRRPRLVPTLPREASLSTSVSVVLDV